MSLYAWKGRVRPVLTIIQVLPGLICLVGQLLVQRLVLRAGPENDELIFERFFSWCFGYSQLRFVKCHERTMCSQYRKCALPGDLLFEEEEEWGSSRTMTTNCTSTTPANSLTRHACQILLIVEGCCVGACCSTSSDASTADASGTYSPLSPIAAREGRSQEAPEP